MSHLVISFVSPDRAGIVDSLSNLVKNNHGNWQASSLHHLSGTFAGVIEISINSEHIAQLLSQINDIEGLQVIHKVSETNEPTSAPTVVLELTANDRVGIVQEISSTIHQGGGNLLKLVSTQESAAHSGQTLFKAKVTIEVDEAETDDLIDAIENLADDLMVDISR